MIDIKAQLNRIEADVRRRINRVMAHCRFIMGPEVEELESALAAFSGVKHCVSCASGTDALVMALMSTGVGPGDAVFTSPFTFIATAEAISLLGATPVFVDIDPDTHNMSPRQLEKAIRAVEEKEAGLHPLPAPALGGRG